MQTWPLSTHEPFTAISSMLPLLLANKGERPAVNVGAPTPQHTAVLSVRRTHVCTYPARTSTTLPKLSMGVGRVLHPVGRAMAVPSGGSVHVSVVSARQGSSWW